MADRDYDLLLLDNHLPDGRVYEYFEEWTRRMPEAPKIMITGAADLTEAIALTRNGLLDYLTKPLGIPAFEASLCRALTRLRARAEVAAGGFREDLLFRIEVFTVPIPPLRERSGEIPALAERILSDLAERYDRSRPRLRAERADLTPLEAQEYRLLRTALQETQGGIRRAAARVGLSPQALPRRLEKWPELRPGR